MQTPAGQSGLQNQEALTGFAEQCIRSHPNSVVADQGMPRFVGIRSNQMVSGLDGQALGSGRDQERRGALVYWHIGIADRYDDKERGDGRVGGEVLSSVDHPVRAVADRTGGEDPWIGAALRLRHRKARKDLPGKQSGQIAVLLILCSEAGDDLGIAGVGRLCSEHDRRPRAATQNLVDQRQLDRTEALPTQFGSQMWCPQAIVADLLFQWVDDAAPLVVQRQEFTAWKQHFEGLDLRMHKLADPVEFLLELRFGGEVPRHSNTP